MNTLHTVFPDLLACATCMGPAGHKINLAAGNAILFMVGIVSVILLSLGGMIFTLARRAKKYAEEHPEEAMIS